MKNYKMKVQYDGTRYKGWQIQKSTGDTIQGKIQYVLGTLVGHPVEVIGSGRTDAGVHASGQIANFHIEESYGADEVMMWLNEHLPQDIAVTELCEVEERFHSRYQAEKKMYRYRIHTSIVPNVFERKYVYEYLMPLDIERMRKAADFLIGTHDFKAFCGNKKMKKSTVRTIYQIAIEERNSEISIVYTGNGFLQNMIRIITGTLIEIGDGRREPEEMIQILESKDRSMAGYTVPPQGLILEQVTYAKMGSNQ